MSHGSPALSEVVCNLSARLDSVPFFPATATMELTPGQVSGMINAAVFFGPLAIANMS